MICKLCCVYGDNVMRGRTPSYNYRILLSISLRGISWLEFSKIRLTTIKDFWAQWSPNFINIPLPKKKKPPKKPKTCRHQTESGSKRSFKSRFKQQNVWSQECHIKL